MTQPNRSNSQFNLIETSTKGRGVFAKTDFAAGALLISEYPLLALSHFEKPFTELIADFSALDQASKDLILDLHYHDSLHFCKSIRKELNIRGEWEHIRRKYGADATQMLAAFDTNAIGPHLGVITAMLNHSCVPNAYAAFDDNVGEITVHSIREIRANEEICISYLEGAQLFAPKDLRREVLHLRQGFTCTCECCEIADTYEANGEEYRMETLRAKWCTHVKEYQRKHAKMMKDFANKNDHWLHQENVTRLRDVSRDIVEVMEEIGVVSVDALGWDEDMAAEYEGKMLGLFGACVGDVCDEYRSIWGKMKCVKEEYDEVEDEGDNYDEL
ncbi:hypothetical protein N0V90_006859 [Kalmusia sp. IMI 367209]|nr:hypothetical protein N0V90_006859 [Kalmusia sp. IMI 367209]